MDAGEENFTCHHHPPPPTPHHNGHPERLVPFPKRRLEIRGNKHVLLDAAQDFMGGEETMYLR